MESSNPQIADVIVKNGKFYVVAKAIGTVTFTVYSFTVNPVMLNIALPLTTLAVWFLLFTVIVTYPVWLRGTLTSMITAFL